MAVFVLVVGFDALGLASEPPGLLAPVFAVGAARGPEPDPERGAGASFLRDTTLTLHLRTFYFNGPKPKGPRTRRGPSGAGSATDRGGSSTRWRSVQPCTARRPSMRRRTRTGPPPRARAGGLATSGEAWGALRYKDYARLTGYRQLVDQGYINPSDIRMTPYTFEGVTVGGRVDAVSTWPAIWKIKPRNSDTFISMAEQAGATGSSGGVGLFGVQLRSSPDLHIDVSNQYGIDTFNTVYARAHYRYPLNDDWAIRLGAEFTDQRAVGAAWWGTRQSEVGHPGRRGASPADLPAAHHRGVLHHRPAPRSRTPGAPTRASCR